MKDPLKDETLLARYASGELSADELEQLKAWEGFAEMERILQVADTLEAPEFDAESLWENLKEKRVRPGRRLPLWIPYGMAAGIALVLGWFFFQQPGTNSFETQVAEQLTVTLPDGSIADLNENTTLEYKRRSWNKDRRLQLKGEAFFQVEKGSTFTVATPSGDVTVLGTSFLVQTEANTLRVRCYTGMVNVDGAGAIVPGEAVEVIDGNLGKRWSLGDVSPPNWSKPFTEFKQAPLKVVVQELEWFFDVKIVLADAEAERLFDGQFLHQDLETALKMVTEPMGLGYEIQADGRVILERE